MVTSIQMYLLLELRPSFFPYFFPNLHQCLHWYSFPYSHFSSPFLLSLICTSMRCTFLDYLSPFSFLLLSFYSLISLAYPFPCILASLRLVLSWCSPTLLRTWRAGRPSCTAVLTSPDRHFLHCHPRNWISQNWQFVEETSQTWTQHSLPAALLLPLLSASPVTCSSRLPPTTIRHL